MEIRHTGGVSGPDPIQPNRISASRIRPAASQPSKTDRADISESAQFLAKLRDVPPIREEKVAALRALIASGQYETSERIAGAVDKLLEELSE